MENSGISYVDTPRRLQQACEAISELPACAIDTEFVWERTYRPLLGLIQIAADSRIYLLDPLELDDLSPLGRVLEDPAVVKVFHAAGMDLRVLWDATGVVADPLFDTQVAAALLGFGGQASYGYLVENVVGPTLDKSETYTDWLRRPLTKKQLDYAAADVRYLIGLYESLQEQLDHRGRGSWAEQEFAAMADSGQFAEPDPRTLYRSVRRSGTLDATGLSVLRELAEWRDDQARQRNVRPQAVTRDEALVELARRQPDAVSSLKGIRGLEPRIINKCGEQIVTLIAKGVAVPEESRPIPAERVRITPGRQATVDLLWALVSSKAETCDVSPELLTSRQELRLFLDGIPEDSNGHPAKVLEGWKRELVGNDILALLEGRTALTVGKNLAIELFRR